MSLDFVANWDLNAFKTRCAIQRELAIRYPVEKPADALQERYQWAMGDWTLRFMLERWKQPLWHGSVSIVDVAYKLDPGLKVDVPQAKPLWTKDWDGDHFAQAHFLLAEMFGPIIRPDDRTQRALETLAAVGLHWHVEWKGNGGRDGPYS